MRHNLTQRCLAVMAVVVWLGTAAATASAASYQTLSLYERTLPPVPIPGTSWFNEFYVDPAINNAGVVVFGAHQLTIDGPPVDGLFIGNGGAPANLIATNLSVASNGLVLNNVQQVAFRGGASGVGGVVKVSGGVAISVSQAIPLNSLGDFVQINDAGNVVFDAIPDTGPAVRTAYVSGGGPIFPVAPAEYGESINNLGVVAVSTGLEIQAIPPVGPTTLLASTGGPIYGLGYQRLNDAGDLLTGALLNDYSTQALYSIHNGTPTLVVPTLPFSYAINNSGGIAFRTTLDGVDGIYTGGNSAADRVIGVGDPLFGAVVNGLGFANDGLNDLGQIAFFYHLTDGRTGIATATPVPEPSTFVLAIAALVALAGWRSFGRNLPQ